MVARGTICRDESFGGAAFVLSSAPGGIETIEGLADSYSLSTRTELDLGEPIQVGRLIRQIEQPIGPAEGIRIRILI